MEKGNHPDNIKKAYRTAYLVAGFLKGSLTEPEKQELDDWINENDHNKKLFAQLTNPEQLQQKLKEYDQTETEYYLQKTKEELRFETRRKKTRLWQYGIAASVIISLAVLWIAKPFSGKQHAIAVQGTDTVSGHLIKPGQEQLTLTLANGKSIILNEILTDSTIDDQLLINDGKELVYQNKEGEPGFHTLTVPRKTFYRLRLPDGTKVMLNASSSLRYPTRFTGNERRVYMSGEGYFEVAHDASRPFRVESSTINGPLVVEAVGTAFNINTYTDEPAPAATLVEGKVNVSLSGKETVQLIPGQQARVTGQGLTVLPGNVQQIAAWTKNEFQFDDTPLREVLRQFARWYDVEFVYQDLPEELIHLTSSRTQSLDYVLSVLSKTGKFGFHIEGQRITITK